MLLAQSHAGINFISQSGEKALTHWEHGYISWRFCHYGGHPSRSLPCCNRHHRSHHKAVMRLFQHTGAQGTFFFYVLPQPPGKTTILSIENRKNVHSLESIFSRWEFSPFGFFFLFLPFLPLLLREDLGGIVTRTRSSCNVSLSWTWPTTGKCCHFLHWTQF